MKSKSPISWILALLALIPAIAFANDEAIANSDLPTEENKLSIQQAYLLGPGDKVKITVFRQDDLSGEYRVDGSGMVAFPLIGNVKAQDKTVVELEEIIKEKLKDGFLKNPKVTVAVNVFRPFFILGEVLKPGSYPYLNGMTVWNAVALGGGFTKRAKKSSILIIRASDPDNKTEVSLETVVMPGDIIEVPQRLF